MAVFVWQDNYNLGIEIIDEQHKVLVRIINDLDELLKDEFSRDKLKALFTELVDYTKYHFSTEERLMKTRGYDVTQLDAHLKQHHQFVQQIQSLNHDTSTLSRQEAEWVLKYLTNWLINHILKVDKHLVEHLTTQESSLRPQSSPSLQSTLHLAESLYEELGANLDYLREESKHPSPKNADPDQKTLIDQVQRELQEVSSLLKQALSHASSANKKLKLEET